MHDYFSELDGPQSYQESGRTILMKGGGKGQSPVQQVVQPPPPPPVIEDAQVKGQNDADMLRRRRGNASTILTGGAMDSASPAVGTKTLLGS